MDDYTLRKELNKLRTRIEALEAKTADSSLPYWVEWVAMDADGSWWGYEENPYISKYVDGTAHNEWSNKPGRYEKLNGYTPPEPVTDWRESKRRVG